MMNVGKLYSCGLWLTGAPSHTFQGFMQQAHTLALPPRLPVQRADCAQRLLRWGERGAALVNAA